jgi:plasmid stabilization system protein ParE
MAREIIWTPEAEKTLSQIVDFLEREWTEKEIQKFLVKIESTIQLIKSQPTYFDPSLVNTQFTRH